MIRTPIFYWLCFLASWWNLLLFDSFTQPEPLSNDIFGSAAFQVASFVKESHSKQPMHWLGFLPNLVDIQGEYSLESLLKTVKPFLSSAYWIFLLAASISTVMWFLNFLTRNLFVVFIIPNMLCTLVHTLFSFFVKLVTITGAAALVFGLAVFWYQSNQLLEEVKDNPIMTVVQAVTSPDAIEVRLQPVFILGVALNVLLFAGAFLLPYFLMSYAVSMSRFKKEEKKS